jgi:hypothetical protein
MANLSIILQAQWVTTDTTLSPSPQIITRQLNNPSLAATTEYYDPFFQTINGTKAIPLPAATVWLLYVRNLSNTTNITLNYTPAGGASTSVILVAGATAGNGGIFLYFQPAETAGGITAATITATAIVSACVSAAA